MQASTRIVLWIVRISGLAQIAVGLLIWTGRGASLVPLHIANGFLIVAALWVLAILALVAGERVGMTIVALAWGVALAAIGLPQARLLVGSSHWVIRVPHLLMGLAALGLADRLCRPILKRVP